jgi:hypothetical protein
MPGYDGAGSVYAVGMRLTKLTQTGAFQTGPGAMLVSDALVKIGFHLDKNTPDAIERKNGMGRTCLYYQPPPSIKGLIVDSIEVCSEDPELEQALGGGAVYLDEDDNPVGYQAPLVGEDPQPYGISVEAFSAAILDGGFAPNLPYMHWVFPRLFTSQGNRELSESALAPVFDGTGNQNSNWGNGPANDFEQDTGAVYQWLRRADVPAPTAGWVALPAQV